VELVDEPKTLRASDLTVALESRIAALGEAGRTVAALLLDEQLPASGAVWRHPALKVALLGPRLAGPSGSPGEHAAAVSAVLKARPQVVVLEEAPGQAGGAWAKAFGALLRSDALRSFKGAVVVCALEETFALRAACSERWALVDGALRQEPLHGRGLEVIEDALGTGLGPRPGPDVAAGSRRRARRPGRSEEGALLEEARSLSEFCFEEDLPRQASAESWTVTLLVEAADGGGSLRASLCHRWLPPPRAELRVERLAVPPKHRGHGYAKELMRWLFSEAARMPRSECERITCSAFEHVVPFYRSLGFAAAAPLEPSAEAAGDPQRLLAKPNASLLAAGPTTPTGAEEPPS